MYLVQFLFSFLERIAFFNCARHSVSGQPFQLGLWLRKILNGLCRGMRFMTVPKLIC